MTQLERLHALVIQQQAALHTGDLDWFQDLVRERMAVQKDLAESASHEVLEHRGLVTDIVRMDRAMADVLREMADRTMEQLRGLAAHERTLLHYRTPRTDFNGQWLEAAG